MLKKKTRILIIAITFIISILSVYFKLLYVFIPIALLMIYMVFAYFKFASVSLAFRQIKQKRLKNAYQLLLDTPNPKLLTRGEKTYYYWGMGIIKISEDKFDEAEREFYNALRFGITTPNNMVVINLSLAQICMYKEEFEKAAVYLDEAKRIPHKPELNVILYELEDKLERLARQELLPESCKPTIMM